MKSTALPVLVLAATIPLVPTAAHAETQRGQATYACQMVFEGYTDPEGDDTNIVAYDTTTSLTIEAPASVEPGESVALQGVLTLQFPEELRQQSYGIADTIEGYSDSASMRVSVAGQVLKVRADRWYTGKTAMANPMVVSAPISFDAFTVPADASGEVEIGLPQNDVLKNPIYRTPGTIAFDGHAIATGPGFRRGYDMSCYLPSSTRATVARIPVRSAATSVAPTSAPDTPDTSGTSGAPGTPGASSGADPVGQPVGQPGDGGSQVAAPPGTSDVPGAEAPTTSARPRRGGAGVASTPDAPVSGTMTTYPAAVPATVTAPATTPWGGWMLVVAGALVCAGLAAVAGHTRRTLTLARRRLDGQDRQPV